jgi:hypothetical protein
MKVLLFALGAGICFAQSSTQIQTNGPSAGEPLGANAGTGQPFGGNILTARPFTAEAVFETDQRLEDGSHIVNRQNLTVARDSQGRTYREEILAARIAEGQYQKLIFIGDPVAQVNYLLGLDHVAHKTPMPMAGAQPGTATVSTSSAPTGLFLQRFSTATGGGKGPILAGTQATQTAQRIAPGDLNTVLLGTQVIAGFEAQGTRTSVTIPAGQIGNQNPLQIVTERWYSQDLQATVLAKQNDPRSGASSFQLTNIQQIEPPASLFQIPSGYTIEEDGK